jgi:alpha-D-ribose 1-methylphosphonate 5-triphosphate synthase subunit PhnH
MKFLTLAPIDANYTFRAMLQTLSRPGTIEALALSDQSQCLPETALMLALIDVETKFAVLSSLEDIDAKIWARLLSSASGAPQAELPKAEWVLSFGEPSTDELNSLARGSANEPEAGCRLIVACDKLSQFASDTSDTSDSRLHDSTRASTTIGLRGPGVNGQITLHVDGLSENFFATLAKINNSFPAGVDVWLCDQLGHLAAISRSTEFNVMQFQETIA